MNDYSTYNGKNDYRAPWLRLSKEQMSDPFGWLLSQRNINVRAILQQMGYDDKQIGFLLHPNQIASKKPEFLQARQKIGQKAVQTYLKWAFNNELKESKQPIKINESTLRKIVAESVKKVLKEEYDWYHYNDGPSTEEETFADELRYVIEEYGLPAARYIGIKDFVSWCVDIINDVVNENKKIFEPADEPEVIMRGEY